MKRASLLCPVELGGVERVGLTTALSERQLCVRVGGPSAGASAGDSAGFKLHLDRRGEPLLGTATVEEVIALPRQRLDRPLVELRLAIRELTEADWGRLESFLAAFRKTVLAVDDDPDHDECYAELEGEYRVLRAATGEQALAVLAAEEVSVAVVAESLQDMHCLSLFQRAAQAPGAAPVRIVVSEFTAAAQLLTFINEGRVFGYLRKPFSGATLRQLVARAVEARELEAENELLNHALERANARMRRENAYLRKRLVGIAGFEHIVGASPELRRVLDEVARVRRTDLTVHLTGETGTGKELVARALHLGGTRSGGPFVAQALTAIPEGLLHSLLFGHKRGAFTGATRDHAGVFEQAHGGTLFLDEVAELAPGAQASLLRALQEGEVTPVGGTGPLPVDVRVISGTHRDLRAEVEQGSFREDLYFRLCAVVICLPPLRERAGDIPLLAMHFLDLQCERRAKDVRGFTVEAMQALAKYPWPGNVRELENEVERLVVFAEDQQRICLELLAPHIREPQAAPAGEEPPAPLPEGLRISTHLPFDEAVASAERALIEGALREALGNVSQAARLLGMERSRLSKLRARLGLGG